MGAAGGALQEAAPLRSRRRQDGYQPGDLVRGGYTRVDIVPRSGVAGRLLVHGGHGEPGGEPRLPGQGGAARPVLPHGLRRHLPVQVRDDYTIVQSKLQINYLILIIGNASVQYYLATNCFGMLQMF